MSRIVTIPIRGKIAPTTLQTLQTTLSSIDQKNTRIILDIDSCGGDTNIAQEIYQVALDHKVDTIGRDVVGSAAVLIFLAGEQRIVTEDIQFYLHCAHFTADEQNRDPQRLASEDLNYAGIVSRRTRTLTQGEILKAMKKGTSFGAQKAVDWGFAHEVLSACPTG